VNIIGGSKSVTLTLGPATDYKVASAFSTATVTIRDDDTVSPPTPGSAQLSMSCLNADGSSAGGSATAILADYIPVVITATSCDPTTVTVYLDWDTGNSGLAVSYSPGGAPISLAQPITLASTDTTIYVFDSNAATDQESEQEVDDDLDLTGYQAVPGNSSVALTPCMVSIAEKPLQLRRDDNDITSATSANQSCNALVGEMINLTVVEPAGQPAVVMFEPPEGNTVKDYQATYPDGTAKNACKPSHLGTEDLVKSIPAAQSETQQLSFAWVAGGSGLNVCAYVWTRSHFQIRRTRFRRHSG
jgi:hypothetical protein